MRVLVTGANGHIGANTVRALLERGHDPVAFVRETADLRGLDGLDVEIVTGDVLDLDSLRRAAEGSEAIIHHAAVFRMWARDPHDIDPWFEPVDCVGAVPPEGKGPDWTHEPWVSWMAE